MRCLVKALLPAYIQYTDVDKNSEDDQKIPQSQTADKAVALWGRDAQKSRHQEDKAKQLV